MTEKKNTEKPSERVSVSVDGRRGSALTWEESVAILAKQLFEQSGLRVHSVSRVPYISQGDLKESYYILDDAVFVLTIAKF